MAKHKKRHRVETHAIISHLQSLLIRRSHQTAHELAQALAMELNQFIDVGEINFILGMHKSIFRDIGHLEPLWSLVTRPPVSGAVYSESLAHVPIASVFDSLTLWSWQRRALEAWQDHYYRGVVEAVTGTGKTRVGIAAAVWAARRGVKTLVIVPTTDLQRQWYRAINESTRRMRVGCIGNGAHDRIGDCDILIATIQSCVTNPSAVRIPGGLIIADEVHRYGGAQWSGALHDTFRYRLGLTATYERNDNGVEKYLIPYFGEPCYRLQYGKALEDGVISPFKIAFLGVAFTADERDYYDQHNDAARRARHKLIHDFDVKPAPFGTFMREVQALANGKDSAALVTARWYLSAFQGCRKVLAGASGKLRRVSDLIDAMRVSNGTLVFTQTKEATEQVKELLRQRGIATGALHAELRRDEREQVLDEFGSGETLVVAAPKLLDEGIDVPEADLAIIVAASRSRRQMVQRLGRVLRKKEDGRLARIVVLYIERTSEDPRTGAHEAFLDLITPVAFDQQRFGAADSPSTICAYLNDYGRVHGTS